MNLGAYSVIIANVWPLLQVQIHALTCNFNKVLAGMNPVPYNGLEINCQVKEHSPCVGMQNLDENYGFLLSQLNLKYLKIGSLG